MTREEFEQSLLALADSLERSLASCTTRVEHVRVSAHAREARRLADVFAKAGSGGGEAAAAAPAA